MSNDVKRALAEYQRVSFEYYRASEERCDRQVALDDACATERRAFARQVRKVAREARAGWGRFEARVAFGVNHATRPFSGSIDLTVTASFYADGQRGKLELSGTIDRQAEVIEQLRAAVCAR